MNKNKSKTLHQGVAKPARIAAARLPVRGRSRQTREFGGAGAAVRDADSLPQEARRLLRAFSQPETRALLDPTDGSSIIIHRKRGGISVGAGRFGAEAAATLVRRDLACWLAEGSEGKTLVLTEAGRACLRRASAPGQDTSFLHQHREIGVATVETETGATRVRVDVEESPLDWLRRRRGRDGQPMIDEASYQAGERLRSDITLAGLMPGVTARWDAMPKGRGCASPSDATDRTVAARQRIRHAFDAIGADFADLLLDLCGFLKGLELIERERHWPPRSAKVVVRLALSRLAEHYGLEAAACGPAASRGIRAWQAVVIEGGRGPSV